MKLSTLLSGVTDIANLPAIEITAITEQATQATRNGLFVCIKGSVADGHHFAKAAYENGCRVFVAEKALALPSDALVLTVLDTRAALAAMACNFYGHPSHKMHLIGITGTKGKTTTAQLLAHILNDAGIPCGYIGTNGIAYADRKIDTRNTTPDAITLQKTLTDMLICGVKTAVIEVSSQALMQSRVDGMRFETVLFTNLTPDHIGPREHASFDHYKDCKKRLFSDFGAKNAILNADDRFASEFLAVASAKERITCSMQDSTADFCATNTALGKSNAALGVSFDLLQNGHLISEVQLPLIGTVNIANALTALATANAVFDIDIQRAIRALQTARVAGRSELISLPMGASAVIDYAHTGESLSHLLSTLRAYQPNRLIVLFGSIGERAQIRRADLGRVAAELSDLAVITSDNPNFENPDRIIAEIAAEFANSSTPYLAIPDRKAAIEAAVAQLQAGDILVLAGKGHEEYQLIDGEKVAFCEREILLQAADLAAKI